MRDTVKRIVVIGCHGALGGAFTECLSDRYGEAVIYGFSRESPGISRPNVQFYEIDYDDELSIEGAAKRVSDGGAVDVVVVATGILHEREAGLMPEKSLGKVSADAFMRVFSVNTVVPALCAKHFIPLLNRDEVSYFVVLSARAGSISDNVQGGWYSYRVSKAGLHMVVKNVAIETRRRNKMAVVTAVFPGVVDSQLSEPFQKFIPEGKLFSPIDSVKKMVEVIGSLGPGDSGKLFDWDGGEVRP